MNATGLDVVSSSEMTGAWSTSSLGVLVGALHVTSRSTRFLVFAANSAEVVAMHNQNVDEDHEENAQHDYKEQSPTFILESVIRCIDTVVDKLLDLDIDPRAIEVLGLATERDTVLAWERSSGRELYNAIVACDERANGLNTKEIKNGSDEGWLYKKYGQTERGRIRALSGVNLTARSPALKIKWLLENVPSVRNALSRDDLLIGTLDSFLLNALTDSEEPVTDLTNASRTQLMNIQELRWDSKLLKIFNIPISVLPKVRACGGDFGVLNVSALKGITCIKAVMADLQASLLSHRDSFFNGSCDSDSVMVSFGREAYVLCDIGIKMDKFGSDSVFDVVVGSKMDEESKTTYAVEANANREADVYKWFRSILAEDNYSKSDDYNCNHDDPIISVSREQNFMQGFKTTMRPYVLLRSAQRCLSYRIFSSLGALEQRLKRNFDVFFDLNDSDDKCYSDRFVQTLADDWGRSVQRRSLVHTQALGVAICAGLISGAWEASSEASSERFMPRVRREERDERHQAWISASRSQADSHHIYNDDYSNDHSMFHCGVAVNEGQIWRSIPAAFFVISSTLILFHASMSQTPGTGTTMPS